jgi:hypothetical protein
MRINTSRGFALKKNVKKHAKIFLKFISWEALTCPQPKFQCKSNDMQPI